MLVREIVHSLQTKQLVQERLGHFKLIIYQILQIKSSIQLQI